MLTSQVVAWLQDCLAREGDLQVFIQQGGAPLEPVRALVSDDLDNDLGGRVREPEDDSGPAHPILVLRS